jgi:hypothetical protein
MAVIADAALQDSLRRCTADPELVAAALAEAAARSLPLGPEDLALVLGPQTPDPRAGFAHMVPLEEAPPPLWLPVALVLRDNAVAIEWLPIPLDGLHHPFFEHSMADIAPLPFTRLMRCVTPLAALDAFAGSPGPDGFVHHMSRCGSTLVAQMLAAVPEYVSIAEAPVIDTMIQLACQGAVSDAQLRNLVAAVTRTRSAATTHRFVKLDCWHSLALPVLRRAFPGVPWAYLYRDAREVLVSQKRNPGMHVRKGAVPFAAFGLPDAERVADGDYAAWVLAHCTAAALRNSDDPACLLVPYPALPDALAADILPHFGVQPSEAQRRAMAQASARNSKQPDRPFTPDSDEKRSEAEGLPRSEAETRLVAFVAALDRGRRGRPSTPAQGQAVSVGYDW